MLFDIYQIFLLPQVKWSVVINNKKGIQELPHMLPNDLRFRILEDNEMSEKSQKFME